MFELWLAIGMACLGAACIFNGLALKTVSNTLSYLIKELGYLRDDVRRITKQK